MSLRPGVEIDRQTLLGMAEDGVYVPQGLGLEDSLHNMALIMDMVNQVAADDTSITPTSQPTEVAEPISSTPQVRAPHTASTTSTKRRQTNLQ